ncbi:DUF5954 family protein [Streptomyces physcomitrii]|uniref:PE-PGRS family protein n=1 Tax=Streptomyces physcomitrii TaxID=2724184 RepID=A0ABX1GXK6_9ACTN|nr:DUF5954 family protein [Streptomyces physcomitrii]NKI40827.1 PE-PGRS family protein [Streptomyces physcomitrii]
MTGYEDRVPAYLTFRVAPQEGPIAAFADQEAWLARERYPDLMGVGLGEFFYATERDAGGWELSEWGTEAPQGARDSLGSQFRMWAKAAEEAGDAKAQKAWTAAAVRLDWEPLDEIRVRGERFRIVRASKFVRMGRSGPEPPRPSDPDPAEVGEGSRQPRRTKGFVVDPYTTSGLSDSILKLDLVQFIGTSPGNPPEVRDDAVRAAENCPGGVLLPAVFMTSERQEGRWIAQNPGSSNGTPQEARDALARWLRVMAPFSLKLSEEKRAEYARAADQLDEKRANSLSVDGRRFRITRVERLVRIGPDGPEGPRPSDFDPEPPVEIHDRRLKEQGLWDEDDEMNHVPVELDARALELKALWEQEEARRAAALERRRSRKRG